MPVSPGAGIFVAVDKLTQTAPFYASPCTTCRNAKTMLRSSCQQTGRAGQTVRLTELVTAARGAACSTGDASPPVAGLRAFNNAHFDRKPITIDSRSVRAVLATSPRAGRAGTKVSCAGRARRVRRAGTSSTAQSRAPGAKAARCAPDHAAAVQDARVHGRMCHAWRKRANWDPYDGVHVAAHSWSAADDGAAFPV